MFRTGFYSALFLRSNELSQIEESQIIVALRKKEHLKSVYNPIGSTVLDLPRFGYHPNKRCMFI
jgi:hypothetical protein